MDPALSTSLHEGIKVLYQDNALTDVVIRVEGQVFPCHRLVLSAVSPYFRSMFTNNFKEKETGEVILQSVEPEIFKCILEYIYFSDKSVINEANVQEILTTASMLLIGHIVNICVTFISGQITVKNAIHIWRLATSIPSERLAQFAKDFILREFKSVAQGDEFLDLTATEIIEIIGEQDLHVTNEETVGDAALRWMSADEEDRKTNLYEVLEHVRLPLTRPEYIFSLSKRFPFLYENLEIVRLLDEAKYFHCQRETAKNCSSQRFIYRNSSEMVNGMIIVLGNCVHLYSFQDQKWMEAASLPYEVGMSFASCVHANNFYISGGVANVLGEMLKFDQSENSWVSVSALGKHRFRHALVADSQMIYLVGGIYGVDGSTTDVTEYNRNQSTCRHIGHLETAAMSIDAVLVEQKIYIFGGSVANRIEGSSMIQCFDLSTNQGSRLTPELFVDVTYTAATQVGESVFLLGGDGNLMEWIDGNVRKSHDCNIGRKSGSRLVKVSMCYHDGHLYICSGKKTEMDVVCIETGKCRKLTHIQGLLAQSNYICAMGAISLPKKYFK